VYSSIQAIDTQSSYRKLLGAVPMRPGLFTPQSCAALNRSIKEYLPAMFTLTQPKAIDFTLRPSQTVYASFSIQTAYMETRVNYFAPPNMVSQTLNYYDLEKSYSTQKVLSAIFPDSPLIGLNSFKPVLIPNSAPLQIENPLVYSAFSQPINALNDSLAVPVPRPLLTSNSNNFSPYVDKQTFTQVRWLTFSKLDGYDSVTTTESSWDMGDFLLRSFVTPVNEQFQILGINYQQNINFSFNGRIVKNFDDPLLKTFSHPLKATITFPWLTNDSSITFSVTLNRPTTDSCYVANDEPPFLPLFDPSCYLRRGNAFMDKRLFNSLEDPTLTLLSSRFFNLTDTQNDSSLNHPFCTVIVPTPSPDLKKEFTSNYRSNAAPQNNSRYSSLGTIFSCELMRYFNSNGFGSIMPVTISYDWCGTPNGPQTGCYT
jgi:hypothetical protein